MASGEAMEPMQAGGSSKGWRRRQAKDAFVDKGNLFLQHLASSNPELAAKYGSEWGAVPEEHAASHELHEMTATFICKVYLIPAGSRNAGQHLDQNTAEGVWSGLLQSIKKRLAKSERRETKVPCAHSAHVLHAHSPAARTLTSCTMLVMKLMC